MATAAERRAARAQLKKSEGKESTVKAQASEVERDDAPEPAPARRSRDVVTVACKVPNGVILQLHTLVDGFEPVFGGGSRPIKVAHPVGDPIKLNGSSRPPGMDPDFKRVVGGYGLTPNVPKDLFEKWMEDNKALDMVKNGLIFAHGDSDRTADQARDQKTIRSGLEPLNVESRKASGEYVDPRMPKNIKKYKAEDDSTDIRGQ